MGGLAKVESVDTMDQDSFEEKKHKQSGSTLDHIQIPSFNATITNKSRQLAQTEQKPNNSMSAIESMKLAKSPTIKGSYIKINGN